MSSEKVICPNCGQKYSNIGNHWQLSSTCDHPQLSARQRDITVGLLLAGGSLLNTHVEKSEPTLRTTSVQMPFLEWLADEFDILSGSIRELTTTGEVHESRTGGTQRGFSDEDSRIIYEWRSRAHPGFTAFIDGWYPDNTKTIPRVVEPSPLIYRVMFAKTGTVQEYRGTNKAMFTTSKRVATAADFARVLHPFEPRVVDHEKGVEQVQLQDTRRFFDQIGYNPVPGYAEKWPDEAAADTLSTVEDHWATCPQCDRQFASLGGHWSAAQSDCTHPAYSTRQRALALGLALMETDLRQKDGGRHYLLEVLTTNRAALEWLADEFGIFAGQLRIASADITVKDVPDVWNTPPGTEFNDIYRIALRAHPVLTEIHTLVDQNTTGAGSLGDATDLPSEILLALYVFRGTFSSKGAERPTYPVLRASHLRLDRDELADWLAPFEATANAAWGSDAVVIQDADSFFEYIGEPPYAAVADKWPPTSRDADDVATPPEVTHDE